MRKKLGRAVTRIYQRLGRPDQFRSTWLRALYRDAYNIDVGLYSYGCFDRDRFNPNMTIGRYCSFSSTCRRVNANHGLEYLSLHPFFYSERIGFASEGGFTRTHCSIEDDVWMGHNAIILPNVTHIGRGAAIAAGAVVTKNVPAYAVVAGVPAKVVRQRFDEETVAAIEKTRWWELDESRLKALHREHPDAFRDPAKNRSRLAEIADGLWNS